MEVTGHSRKNTKLSKEHRVLVLTLVSFDQPYLMALFSSFLGVRVAFNLWF